MIRTRMSTSRWCLAVATTLWAFAAPAPAQSAGIAGVYNGSYPGDQGPIKFKLSIAQQDNTGLSGAFTLYLSEGSEMKAYRCDVAGYVQHNGTFLLKPGKWDTSPPSGFEMAAGMNGRFDPGGGNGAGQISGNLRSGGRRDDPRPKFEAIRDADETARMVSATEGSKEAGAPAPRIARSGRRPAVPVAQSERRPTVAKPAAPSPPSSSAEGPGIWHTAINGVYTGTYGTNVDDNVPAKLYINFIDNGSVNGVLDGLFTFDVPPTVGAEPITYTYKLIGVTEPGNGFIFHSAKPLGKPAPDAYAVTQLAVYFVKSFVLGSTGQNEARYDRDHITARVFGNKGRINNKLEAVRDKAESANVDSLMAAQASAASAVSTTAPAQPPNSPPAASTDVASPTRKLPPGSPGPTPSSGPSADIDNMMAAVRGSWTTPAAPVLRPGMLPQGVFNGTYTRENEPPTRFKLTITRTNDNLGGMVAGMATIYLPTDSGTKAYTYSLLGHYAERDFTLRVQDWETAPPKDFKNFKGMGFNGRYLSNMNQNTARIISVREPGPNASMWDGLVVPQFEATWDPTESADIKGTLAAQKAVGDADQIAALKEHAVVLKNAQPKQLASKYLVRKSQAYWDSYRSDFIREVFDGGFADDVDIDPAFQSLFIDYVDLFSSTCPAYLPAGHRPITIVTTVTTRYPGGAVTSETTSKTVEIDPRFIDKYAEYSGVDPEPGSEQEKEQTAKTVAIVGYIFHRGGPSHGVSFADANALMHLAAAHGLLGGGGMEKFFATEVKAGVPSAALRQMGENLLRGATGEPSLQEAGARIAGAEAETDPNLPPGRFTHLVDAAHAYYRANARLRGRFQTAFDETLAAKYRGVMSREEEYYYANDFENRFHGQIMQPRSYCKDPAWPRLHPAVEECVQEVSQ